MSNVLHDFPSKPEGSLIEKFISRLFNSSGVRGRVELAWTDIQPPHRPQFAQQFDLADLDILAEKAVSLNSTPNRNVYVSAGLRRVDIPASQRASDDDVRACVACWADFDTDGALDAALSRCSELGITPNIVVITGEHPHKRGQMWWVLDEPCDDLARHKLIQQQLAKVLGGDPTVTNASRIMRICGSVAWPMKAGRRVEVTHLEECTHREGNFTIDEIAHALLKSGQLDTGESDGPGLLDFTNAESRSPTDIQNALIEGLKTGQFHLNMRQAVASMLAQGTPPRVVFDTISAMVRKEGNNVAERIDDLRRLVHGGIEKGIYQPAAARGVPIVDVEQAKQRFVLNSHEQLLDRDPPEWMIEKFITRRSLSAIYAPPASFKSFIGLDMGLCIAVGHEWHGFATSPARVVYVGSEGSGSVGMRIQAWANARLAGALIPPEQFLHLGVDVNMLDPVELRGFIDAVKDRIDPDLIIVDTVARNFGSGDENSTKDMSAFVNNIGRLMEALETSVMLIHHTGKDEAKGARGSSALNGALDHTFRLKREEGSDRVKLITTKQKETDEHAPIFLQMGRVEVTHPKTGEIVSSLVPVRSEPDAGAPDSVTNQEAYAGLRRVHHDILAAIKANPGELNVHQLAKLLGKDIHNFKKTIRLLSIDRGLIRADDSGFYFVVADDHKEGDEDD